MIIGYIIPKSGGFIDFLSIDQISLKTVTDKF